MLPPFPSSFNGRAIHQLFSSHIASCIEERSLEQVESAFDNEVESIEREMRSNWLTRSLVPLSKHIGNYHIKRRRACNLLISSKCHTEKYKNTRRIRPNAMCGVGHEITVATRDSRMRGRIDHAFYRANKLVLRELKSGAKSTYGGSTRIKVESYARQLKMYAFLYYSSFNRWPDVLEILTLAGNSSQIQYNQLESRQLVNDSLAWMNRINLILASAQNTPTDTIQSMGKPSPFACGYCLYRPACRVYTSLRVQSKYDSKEWPRDVVGFVDKIVSLKNGFLAMDIVSSHTKVSIRGLNPSPHRHPALAKRIVNQLVGVYNVKPITPGVSYRQSGLTTIYQLQEGAE